MADLRKIASREFKVVPGKMRKAELIHTMRKVYWSQVTKKP
jgi:hypothetical protein